MDKLTGIISSAELMGGQIVGMRGLKGDKGDTGNGIASIAKTSTSGDIDTYTITFTDGDTTTFNVTNGHTPVITQVPVATDLWTGTAIYVDGVYLTTIMDGAKGDTGDTGATGATGNGIASITLTDTTGSVKTYTITFTNGDTTTFQVTDGEVTNAILEKVLPTDTKSGSIASFPDGTDLFPALKCVADIDPVQDLHGYDAPWVGGAGKNKLPLTVDGIKALNTGWTWNGNSATINGITCTLVTDSQGTITAINVNGTASATTDLRVGGVFGATTAFVPNGSYTLSGNNTNTVLLAGYGSTVLLSTAGTTTATCPDGISWLLVRVNNGQNPTNEKVYPMICASTATDPTVFAPYSNICPISGWTGVDVVVDRINQWDEVWEVGGLDNNTGLPVGSTDRIRSKNFCPCRPNTPYYTYFGSSVSTSVYLCWYDESKNYISFVYASNGVTTSPPNAYYFKIKTYGGNYTTYLNDISVNYPSTDHDYHAYNGTTYTVSWSGDAGTVYGGTLDVVSGELTVDRRYVVLDGVNNKVTGAYGSNAQRLIGFNISSDPATGATLESLICDSLTPSANILTDEYAIALGDGNSKIIPHIAGMQGIGGTYADNTALANAINTWLSNNNVTCVYELATPTTYTLTAQQVDLLLGQNTVFADTGDVTVEYKADIQRYIAKKLAE